MSGYMNFGVFGPNSALLDGLIHWWELDEASGTRVDKHGGLSLTEYGGSTGSGTGHVNPLAANFVSANNRQLERDGSHCGGQIGGTVAMWLKANNNAVSYDWAFLFGPFAAGAAQLEVWMQGNTIFFRVNNDNSPQCTVTVSNIASWTSIIGTWDATTSQVYGNLTKGVNDGLTTSWSMSSSFDFIIGNRSRGNTQGWDGLIGPVAFSSRIWTADDRAEFHNGGSGISYPG